MKAHHKTCKTQIDVKKLSGQLSDSFFDHLSETEDDFSFFYDIWALLYFFISSFSLLCIAYFPDAVTGNLSTFMTCLELCIIDFVFQNEVQYSQVHLASFTLHEGKISEIPFHKQNQVNESMNTKLVQSVEWMKYKQ